MNAVVYFADDDNSYDQRLFSLYIRRTKGVACWPVGFASWLSRGGGEEESRVDGACQADSGWSLRWWRMERWCDGAVSGRRSESLAWIWQPSLSISASS